MHQMAAWSQAEAGDGILRHLSWVRVGGWTGLLANEKTYGKLTGSGRDAVGCQSA